MIDNPRSPRVRASAILAKKSARSKTGLFLVEGPQAIAEAVQYAPDLVDQVFITDDAFNRYSKLTIELNNIGVELIQVSNRVMETIADTVSPQGIVAVCRQPNPQFSSWLDTAKPKRVVILEQVRDPGNAGTIIRVADAAGVDAVIVTNSSVDIYSPKVVRSTTGSLFHLPVFTQVSLLDAVTKLHAVDVAVFAADISGTSLVAAGASGLLAKPHAWLFGNEAQGLGAEQLALADEILRIPHYGLAESMNLGTAAAVCIFQSAFISNPS